MAHVDVLSDGVGWALMNSPLGGPIRVYRTRDGGRSWTPVDGLQPGGPLFLRVFDDLNAVVGWREAASYAAALYATADGGATWQRRSALPPMALGGGYRGGIDYLGAAVSFPDPLNGWMLGSDSGGNGVAVYRTDDGGQHWSSVASFSADSHLNALAITFSSAGEGWLVRYAAAASDVYLLHSLDGGASWVKVPLQPPPSIGITAFFAPVVTDPQGGAATSASVGEGSQGVGAPESLYVYGKPARGGWLGPLKVWSGKTVVTGIPVLQAAGGSWWLSVGATVSTSRDGGLHFATHALPMPADAIGIAYDFVDALNAYILVRPRDCSAGCTTTLLATTDAGNSWDTRTAPG